MIAAPVCGKSLMVTVAVALKPGAPIDTPPLGVLSETLKFGELTAAVCRIGTLNVLTPDSPFAHVSMPLVAV